MFARVVIAQCQPDKMDEGITITQSLETLWQQQKGFQGADLLVNRETGKILTISCWESRADLEATETSGWYQEQVTKFAKVWAAPPVREIYEVAVQVEKARAVGSV